MHGYTAVLLTGTIKQTTTHNHEKTERYDKMALYKLAKNKKNKNNER